GPVVRPRQLDRVAVKTGWWGRTDRRCVHQQHNKDRRTHSQHLINHPIQRSEIRQPAMHNGSRVALAYRKRPRLALRQSRAAVSEQLRAMQKGPAADIAAYSNTSSVLTGRLA